MHLQQVGNDWLASLSVTLRRNGKPLAENSIRIYSHNFRRLADRLGSADLPVTNRQIKEYVSWMRGAGYSPASIISDVTTLKLAVESLKTDDGLPVYPLKLAHDFIGTPVLSAAEQRGPCAVRQEVETALRIPALAGLAAIAAGSGLRISEILALELGDNSVNDAWEPGTATIHVRKTLKTPAAKRDIPITVELNEFLIGHFWRLDRGRLFGGFPRSTIYQILQKYKLPPMHSFRRFRVTAWSKAGMNPEVSKRLSGHSKGSAVHDRYDFAEEDAVFARTEVQRCKLGFDLP